MSLVFLKTDNVNILKSSEGYRVVRQKMVREDRPAYFVFVAWSPSRQLGVVATGGEARSLCNEDLNALKQGGLQ